MIFICAFTLQNNLNPFDAPTKESSESDTSSAFGSDAMKNSSDLSKQKHSKETLSPRSSTALKLAQVSNVCGNIFDTPLGITSERKDVCSKAQSPMQLRLDTSPKTTARRAEHLEKAALQIRSTLEGTKKKVKPQSLKALSPMTSSWVLGMNWTVLRSVHCSNAPFSICVTFCGSVKISIGVLENEYLPIVVRFEFGGNITVFNREQQLKQDSSI